MTRGRKGGKIWGMEKEGLKKYLENTLGAIDSIWGVIKTADTVRLVSTYLIYTAYLVYRIATGGGYLALNICLLALTFFYGVFALTQKVVGKKYISEKVKKGVDTTYTVFKRIFTFVGLGLTVSSILVAVNDFTALDFAFAILSGVFACLQIIFDIVFALVGKCFEIIKTAILADVNNFMDEHEKQINMVKGAVNVVGKIGKGFAAIGRLKNKLLPKKEKKNLPPPDAQPTLPPTELPAEIDHSTPCEVAVTELPAPSEETPSLPAPVEEKEEGKKKKKIGWKRK